jgi:hypothetical protein
MGKDRLFIRAFAVCSALCCLSCAVSSGRVKDGQDDIPAFISEFKTGGLPANVRFTSSPVPEFRPAPGLGLVAGGERDPGGSLAQGDPGLLSDSFRSAYAEGILRGTPLAGVLGGDLVHGWPQEAPVTWVQNWRGSTGRNNSWGMPNLILAVRGLSHDRVFLVQGLVLDVYGMSGGIGGANGAAGYGAPCGEEFLLEGRAAQRFDRGLITFTEAGKPLFIPGDAPSLAAAIPDNVGVLSSGGNNAQVLKNFQTAWRAELDSGLAPLEPDTPVIVISFADSPWALPVEVSGKNSAPGETAAFTGQETEKTTITITNIYYQPFGGGKTLFIMVDGFIEHSRGNLTLPLYPRILGSPFLEALLNAGSGRSDGADTLNPVPIPPAFEGKKDLTRLLLEGIALYGIPLSDALPWHEGGKTLEAQRFSQGWLVTR